MGSASLLSPFRSPTNSGSVRYAAIASRSFRSSSHSHRDRTITPLNKLLAVRRASVQSPRVEDAWEDIADEESDLRLDDGQKRQLVESLKKARGDREVGQRDPGASHQRGGVVKRGRPRC